MSFGATTYSHFAAVGQRDWLIVVSTTANITNGPLSNLVNGSIATGNSSGVFVNSADTSKEFKFTFPWKVRIDEFKWYQDAIGSQGTWKFAGSNDDSVYVDLLTGINLGSVATQTVAVTNPDGYKFYKLIQTGGTMNTSRWMEEIEFKVALDSAFGAGTPLTATSYSNQDGAGNRTARMLMLLNSATACGGTPTGIMNAMLNGVTGAANCTDATAFRSGVSSNTITMMFREPLVIDEFTWKQQNVNSHGTWKIQGSLDNVTYTDIATGIVIGAANATEAHAFTNVAGYNFYRLFQTSGTTNAGPWVYEIEFKTSLLAPPLSLQQPVIVMMQ